MGYWLIALLIYVPAGIATLGAVIYSIADGMASDAGEESSYDYETYDY